MNEFPGSPKYGTKAEMDQTANQLGKVIRMKQAAKVEEAQWTTHKVLDHGYVHLLDSMPHWSTHNPQTGVGAGDLRIEQAARVSMSHLPDEVLERIESQVDRATEHRTLEQTQKLVKYLVDNRHTSPLEKVRFEFVVRLPIFVARQWIRHRTGCLAGDVKLIFERPVDGKAYPKAVEDVFRSFQDPRQVARARQMRLRCVNEQNLKLGTTSIKSVWESGIQDVYLVVTKREKTLRLTDSHQVFTERGWELFGAVRSRFEAGEATELRGVQNVGGPGVEQRAPSLLSDSSWIAIPGWEGRYEVSDQGRVRSLVNTHGRPLGTPVVKRSTLGNNGYPCVSLSKFGVSRLHTVHSLVSLAFNGPTPVGLEIRHSNGNRLDSRVSNLEFGTSLQNTEDMFDHDSVCRLEVRPEEIAAIEFDGTEMTYDLEVEGPHHNFVANDLVVHNSFNEQSARYSQLPKLYYVPTVERMQGQHSTNKQASGAPLDPETAQRNRERIIMISEACYVTYEEMLKDGVARELARMVLPLNMYTTWFWTTDLHNLFGWLRLRSHDHAQSEIQAYAKPIWAMVSRIAPLALQSFVKREGISLVDQVAQP